MKGAERGITLIALIITIVVMLLLVGVSLQVALQSGLFDVTGNAVGQLDKEWQNETEIAEGKVTVDEVEYNTIDSYIEELNALPAVGAGEMVPKNEKRRYKSGDKTAIIPGGFTVSGISSESTIEGGLVIYLIDKSPEEIEKIDWNDETTVATLQTTCDQFVWIPIENINDMYICQAKDGTNEDCNITVEDGVTECQIHKNVDNEKATKMAGYLYTNYAMTEKIKKYTENSERREPDIVTGDDSGTGTSYDGSSTYLSQLSILGKGYDSTDKFKERLQEEYNEIVKSVYLNKGFYVGRYETSGMVNSDTNATIKVIAGTTNGIGNATWYRMYAQAKKYAENKSLTTVVGSTMIQGAAYDQVMKFVSNGTRPDGKLYSITTVGNVGHDLSSIYQTGGRNYKGTVVYNDCIKNIYDLEGNVWAWTTEAGGSSTRVRRGGGYRGSDHASFRYDNNPSYCSGGLGGMVQLYII